MKSPDYNQAALMLIDFQEGFNNLSYWGAERNNVDAEKKCGHAVEALAAVAATGFSYQTLFGQFQFVAARKQIGK